MENKFTLTNTVLYAKGWYLNTGDLYKDLKKILELDGYMPFSELDIYSIILYRVEDYKAQWTKLSEVLNSIHPSNCWKYGYYVKENSLWSNKPINELPDYHMPTAFIYYVLSNLRFIDKTSWNLKTPKLTKYPKGKDVTIRNVYESFVMNKLNK